MLTATTIGSRVQRQPSMVSRGEYGSADGIRVEHPERPWSRTWNDEAHVGVVVRRDDVGRGEADRRAGFDQTVADEQLCGYAAVVR